MEIKEQIDILSKGRALMLKVVDGLTLNQINKVPEGFNNNIGWNIAHLITTQQLLCYKMSGLDCRLESSFIEKYKKGESPKGHIIDESEWEYIKDQFLLLPNLLEEDYDNGMFKSYNDYTTSVDVTLDSIEKAIAFNNFHEGIHLGVLLAQKKLV